MVTNTQNTDCLSHLLCCLVNSGTSNAPHVRNNGSELQVTFNAGRAIVTSTHKPNYVEIHYKLKTACLLENIRVNCHFVSRWQSEDIITVAILISLLVPRCTKISLFLLNLSVLTDRKMPSCQLKQRPHFSFQNKCILKKLCSRNNAGLRIKRPRFQLLVCSSLAVQI